MAVIVSGFSRMFSFYKLDFGVFFLEMEPFGVGTKKKKRTTQMTRKPRAGLVGGTRTTGTERATFSGGFFVRKKVWFHIR